jgi:two-component system chemotaxis sensor kinase CheA
MSTNFDHALPAFLDEANELLIVMEGILMDLQGQQPDSEQLNAMFRAMHTIKGSSGLFGLDAIVHFTHEAENLLEALRSGELIFNDELANLLLQCHDHVKTMLAVIYDTEKLQELAHPPLIAQLQAYFADKTNPHIETANFEPESSLSTETAQQWLLSLRFAPDVLCNGMDPLSFINYLSSIGTITAIEPVLTRLPSGDSFDPETNYLRFELLFSGEIEEKKLNDVFEFVRDDSDIHIFPMADAAVQFQCVTMNLSLEEGQAVAAAWEQLGILFTDAVDSTVTVSEVAYATVDGTSDDNFALAAKIATGAELTKTTPKTTKPAEVKFIKVEASKLDSLINLIGELVIAGASANLIARNSGETAQIESTATIATLIEQIRAGTLSMRMVQIGEIFSRFPRVVRDVSKELGKQIELHISGADTELDKSMVDKLGDPLMHIVRNAIDHGIESAAQRLQNGKAAIGNVWLNAYHESGSIVIEVADDGGGLRKDKILAKAVSNGLISADAVLSDSDIYKLIFEPGFSTADAVSNISGRGVGMDVVKRGLEALRGSIDIDSAPGEGTHFRIRLPLTLAIIDGFLVQIGQSTFVIPLEVVVECIEIPDDLRADGKHSHLNLRGEVLPVLNLNEFLELGETPGKRQNVVVVNCGDSKAGLLVDNLLGEFQTVIKPLGTLFNHLRSISGSTILGTGEVALILDVPSLIHVATRKESELYAQKRLHSG